MANILPEQKLGYPSSDGNPMAETGIHVVTILMLHQALLDYFRDRPDVYIASDMFWYWKEGDVTARIAPDVMVIPGVGNHLRRSFFSWEEPNHPQLVFEIASKSTWEKDLSKKHNRYRKLKVPEYIVFDPEALYLPEPLIGYRLNGNRYVRMTLESDGSLATAFGFRVRPEGTNLRLVDSATGHPIPTQREIAESERKRADVERQRAEAARTAAAAAKTAADEEKARAEAEKARADALAAEVERLKSLLQQQSPPTGTNP